VTEPKRVRTLASLHTDLSALFLAADLLMSLSEGETVCGRPQADTMRAVAGILERIAENLGALHDMIAAWEGGDDRMVNSPSV